MCIDFLIFSEEHMRKSKEHLIKYNIQSKLDKKRCGALRQLINTLINQSANASTLQYYSVIDAPLVL